MINSVEITPVQGMPEVAEGDDLAELIAARFDLVDGDVLVVSQKVVSKAEGAVVQVGDSADADVRRRLARAHASAIVADVPWVLVTRTSHGLVCANGGIDGSNAEPGTLVLLPEDPDDSARRLRARCKELVGADVAVLVTDTFGRPWRLGQTDVAIGLAGMSALRDERGGADRQGVRLEATQAAVADELAAAADLVRRKADGVPAVVIRGWPWEPDEQASARDLVRPLADDVFRQGAGMVAAALAANNRPAQPIAGSAVAEADAEAVRSVARAAGADLVAVEGGAPSAWQVVGDRAALGAVTAALLDLGYRARWRDDEGQPLIEAGWEQPGLRGR